MQGGGYRAIGIQAVRDRVVADFEGTLQDQAKFDAQLVKILGALKKRAVTETP